MVLNYIAVHVLFIFILRHAVNRKDSDFYKETGKLRFIIHYSKQLFCQFFLNIMIIKKTYFFIFSSCQSITK